jgi:phospholipase/carboxylesterase
MINNMLYKKIITSGKKIQAATKALIMIHGRGGSAEDILSLAEFLDVTDFALLAPQAFNNSWYPNSFLAQPRDNEPALSNALNTIDDLVNEIQIGGIVKENIFFLGFSQGACLALEYATRHAVLYGGIVAFTGGLIGDRIYLNNYKGDFAGTPVFIGTCSQDPHVPLERVYATAAVMQQKNGIVTEKVYDNMGHTINHDEIKNANRLIFNKRPV